MPWYTSRCLVCMGSCNLLANNCEVFVHSEDLTLTQCYAELRLALSAPAAACCASCSCVRRC